MNVERSTADTKKTKSCDSSHFVESSRPSLTTVSLEVFLGCQNVTHEVEDQIKYSSNR